jgi:hypothetical protein
MTRWTEQQISHNLVHNMGSDLRLSLPRTVEKKKISTQRDITTREGEGLYSGLISIRVDALGKGRILPAATDNGAGI